MFSVSEPMLLVRVTASEDLGNPQRPHGVNVENCRPGFVIDIPSFLVWLARNARAVDEDIDGAVFDLRRCLLDAPEVRYVHGYNLDQALRANDDETNTCREFTLGGIGQTSSGYAPNQRQQDFCSSRR